jgi:hypothetical protein
MARGIYKRTMNRASSASSGNRESTVVSEHNGSSDSRDALVAALRSSDSRDALAAALRTLDPETSTAKPLGGKRTLLGDRAVARRARSRSKTKKIRRLKLLATGLVFAIIGVSMGWILASAKLELTESELMSMASDLRRAETLLDEARVRLEKRENELLNFVEDRIPGLAKLEFNKLIDIHDKYVLSVTFAESGVGSAKGIEYHATLKNETADVILPDVKIFMFDEFGLQSGVATLRIQDATRPTQLAELAPGETRSYNASIEIDRDLTPKYYMVYVR